MKETMQDGLEDIGRGTVKLTLIKSILPETTRRILH